MFIVICTSNSRRQQLRHATYSGCGLGCVVTINADNDDGDDNNDDDGDNDDGNVDDDNDDDEANDDDDGDNDN